MTIAATPTPALHRDLAREILLRMRARGAASGARLSRLALAKELGVSRTPIAGAIAVLERMGVVATEGRAVRLLDAGFDPDSLGPAEAGDETARLIVLLAQDRRAGTLPEDVSERQLQTRYGAGRPLVAAVLRRLAEIGAVTRNRGHGWRFAAGYASAEDRQASYRFRLMVEPAGLLEPGFRLDPAWAASMREAHGRFLGRAWRDTDPVRYFETNAAFHLGLAQASGNRFLVQAIAQQNQLRAFRNIEWESGVERVRVSASEHLGILAALEAGDGAEAAERMHRHLAGTAALPFRPSRPAPAG